jgi:hypothetical protein
VQAGRLSAAGWLAGRSQTDEMAPRKEKRGGKRERERERENKSVCGATKRTANAVVVKGEYTRGLAES